jgi:hypothetical protein
MLTVHKIRYHPEWVICDVAKKGVNQKLHAAAFSFGQM